MAWYDGIKQFGSDCLAVGKQVFDGVINTGKSAAKGVKTLVTDPGQFVKDVGDLAGKRVSNIVAGVSEGTEMIGEGWNEAWATGNPGHFLWKALGGTAQIASLGTIHEIKEHIAEVSEVKYDELGNMTGYEISDDADAITRIFLRDHGSTIATAVNGDAEIKEAIAEGDTEKANKMLGHVVSGTVLKPAGDLMKTAAVVVPVAGTVVGGVLSATGVGAPVGAPILLASAAALTAGGIVASGAGANGQLDFDAANIADDVADKIDAEVKALRELGRLTDEQETDYRDAMNTYYTNAAYGGLGDELGAAYLGEGATNKDLKAVILQGKNLPSPDEPDVVALMQQHALAEGRQIGSLTDSVAEHTGTGGVPTPAPGAVAMELTPEEAAAVMQARALMAGGGSPAQQPTQDVAEAQVE